MRASATLQSFVRDLAAGGERPAVVAMRAGGPVTVTHAELATTSLRLATGLSELGLGVGDPVAIVAPNGLPGVILRLALGALGAVAVALDETESDEEIAAGLVESGAGLVFASPAQSERLCRVLRAGGPPIYRLDRAGDPGSEDNAVPSWLGLLAPALGALPVPDPAAPAVLLLGGGSGSASPPFRLSHANLLAGAAGLAAAGLFGAKDRVVLALPLDQVYPLSVGLYGVLASGAALVLPEAVTGRQLRRAIRRAGATAVIGVPALYEAWLAAIEGRVESRGGLSVGWFETKRVLSRGIFDRLGLHVGRALFPALHREIGPRLRRLISGAGRFDREVARDLAALGWRVTDGYTVSRVAGFVAVGRPLAGLTLRAVRQDGTGLGEIELSGPQVAIDTGEGGPFLTGDGWLRTGDLGRLDDDRLDLAGPAAERITLGGRSFFAEALEAVYRDCPLVEEIAVFERDGSLHACVLPDLAAVAEDDSPRIEDVVRRALDERAVDLPDSHALSAIALLRNPLPRSSLGRLQRELLPALYEQAANRRHRTRPAALSEDDRALLAAPRAHQVWDWLQARMPGRTLGLNLDPQLDLEIDSLGWLMIGIELEQRFGVCLEEDTLSRMRSLREFIIEVVRAPDAKAGAREAPRVATLDPAQRRWVTPPGLALNLLASVIHGVAGPLVRRFFRLRAEGLENLPAEGGFMIAVNHASRLDPFIVAAALPRGCLRRSYWGVGGTWPTGILARALRRFPVEERAPGRSLAVAHEVLSRGQPLVWFPEGRCAPDGALQQFLPGVGALVAETGVPLVPARIVGGHGALPPGRSLPRRHPVRIVFGKPLAARDLIARAGARSDFAAIAEVVRGEVAKLPAHDRGRERRFPLRRRLGWLLEAGAAWTAYGLLAVLPLDAASGLCGFLARKLGPRLGPSRIARRNLERAFADRTPAEIDAMLREMWDNLGRNIGELVHLDRIGISGPEPRIEVVGLEHVDPVRRDGKPCIVFTAHLGNWELAGLAAALHDLPLTAIYRRANNPYVEGLIQRCRGPHRSAYVPKGANAARRIATVMRQGGTVGMLADQKTNNGVAAPFFGREAMTTRVLALCALSYDCTLLPTQIERLNGARFRVTVHPPLEITPSGDKAADIRAITGQVNATIEGWVRQRPAQWLWLHRRWSD